MIWETAVEFPGGDPRRGDLDAVHADRLQQDLGDAELLHRGEGDPLGLLAVAQRGVEEADGAPWRGVGHVRHPPAREGWPGGAMWSSMAPTSAGRTAQRVSLSMSPCSEGGGGASRPMAAVTASANLAGWAVARQMHARVAGRGLHPHGGVGVEDVAGGGEGLADLVQGRGVVHGGGIEVRRHDRAQVLADGHAPGLGHLGQQVAHRRRVLPWRK